MGVLNKIERFLKFAENFMPIVEVFVPGARNVTDAVKKIHADPARNDNEADKLNAAVADNHEARLSVVEKRLGIK